ncbi:flavin-dependent monooxygenase [Pseudomonas sp. Z1-14]
MSRPLSAPAELVDFSKLTEQPAFIELMDEVLKRRDEIHARRHVPKEIVSMMKAARIFRSATPVKFGGDALPPHHFLKMIDKLGEVDGSTAWVAAFGSANTYYAALPEEAQAVIYANGPDQVFAGGLYPVQQAKRVENGWIASGRWKFASGCMGADWISMGIQGRKGSSDMGGGGASEVLMAVAPAEDVQIIETWDAMGMRGTGSHDIQVEDRLFTDFWTCPRGARSIYDDSLYRYPLLAYQAQVHAACNLGLARAALNLAINMSGGAKIMPGAPRLVERAYFRTALAQGEARLRSARAFFYETAEKAWEELQHQEQLSVEAINLLRLSASHAAHASAETVQDCYRVVGMAAIQENHPMQRILRDCLVVTQHAALNDSTFENAGALLSGAPETYGYP